MAAAEASAAEEAADALVVVAGAGADGPEVVAAAVAAVAANPAGSPLNGIPNEGRLTTSLVLYFGRGHAKPD